MLLKKIVVDTGIIVSASFWGGVPRQALYKAQDEGVLIFTQATLFELTRVFSYSKFDSFLTAETRFELMRQFASNAQLAFVTRPIRECEDPNDDIILEAAFYGKVDCVIASDKKIAKMHPFRKIPIFSPTQYLES